MPGCFVYVLTCRDGSLYVGWTTDLAARLKAHRSGAGSRYVRSRLPAALRAWWTVPNRSAALRGEAHFRALTRSQKLAALAAGQVGRRCLHNVPPDDPGGTDADPHATHRSRTRPTRRRG